MVLLLSSIFVVASHILQGVDSLKEAKMRAISIVEREQERSMEF